MRNFFLFILCTYACGIVAQEDEDWRLVNLAQGPVRGRKDAGDDLYNFYNIPYATAPTGTNRFKAPLPPPVRWSTFDAVDRGIICPQPFMNIQEDCLIANVFVPDTDETNLPVMIFIHGGAYQYGYGNQVEFKDLVRTKKVIAVTFNYRLGVHGFLCLGTEGVPGNAGIKDQVALLRWVNTNIASFGGNPEDVTLVSCSAGSGSIDVLSLSNITSGLFTKAIIESGVSTGAVGVQIDPIENAKSYAKLLHFNDVDNLDSLEEFYRAATFETLTSQHQVITGNKDVAITFGPCVEKDIGQERVLDDAPMNIIKQGNYKKVPLLYGFTNMEGSMRLPNFDSWKDEMNANFSNFLPAELYFENDSVKEEIAQKVKEHYFGDEAISEDTIIPFILYFTDVLFAYPMIRSLSARVESRGDTIYLFEYSFVDENTPNYPNTDVSGAGHCDPLFAIVDQNTTNSSDEYRQMIKTMREYWLTFILTGSPSTSDSGLPSWPPTNAQRNPHMSLGSVIELKDNILENRAAFWDDIYDQYYRGPVLPVSNGGAVSLMISKTIFATVLIFYYFAILEL